MRFVVDVVLPKEYKRLKYLENTAGVYANNGGGSPSNYGSYINTGIHPKPNGKVKIGIKFNDWGNNTPYQALFGGYDNNTKNFGVVVNMKSGTDTTYFVDGTQTSQDVFDYEPDTYYDFEYSALGKSLSINENNYLFLSVTPLSTQSNLSIYLFTDNSVGGSMEGYNTTYTMKGKIYYFKYYEGDALKNNLIPVLRISDNEPGMYDTMTGNFFTNAGIGNFSYELEEEEPDSIELLDNPNYKQVEYLQGTGTQYIDTGYAPVPATTKFDFVFSPDTISGNSFIFGARPDTSAASQCTCTTYFATGSVRQDWAGLSTYFPVTTVGTKYRYTAYNNTINLNEDSVTGTSTRSTTRLSQNFLLFTVNTNGTVDTRRFIGKIYYAKLWDNGTLVRNFIPAVRKSDNKPGMYDKVNDVFYTNAGTDEFLYGSFVGPLPAKYKELEYIESSGTQYIDTGCSFNSSTDEIELYYQNTSTLANKWLFGSYENNANIGISSANLSQVTFWYKGNVWGAVSSQYDSEHILRYDSTGMSNDGVNLKAFTSYTGTWNIYLFALNNTGTSPNDYFGYGKIWAYKHKRNGVFIRDFVPCYKVSNGEAGLYDRVTGAFFANAGTGSFIKGEKQTPIKRMISRLLYTSLFDTIDGYRRIEYLESTGPQYIDTGIVMKSTNKIECRFQVLSATTGNQRNYIFGADTVATGVQYSYSSSTFFGVAGRYQQNDVLDMNTDIHLAEVYDGKIYLDGVSLTLDKGTGANPYTSTKTIHLFGFNDVNGHTDPTVNDRVYYYKMWDNDVLVRDFYPVLDENNEPCLYDKVTKALFKNKGTGDFVAGNRLRTLKCVLPNDLIPSEYKQLKYIQSTGTQYIDTGVLVNNTLNTDIKFEVVDKTQGGHIFGGRTVTSGGRGYGVYLPTTGGIGFDYETRTSSTIATTNGYAYRVIKDGASNTLYVNGVESYTGNNTDQEFDLDVSLALFYMKDINTTFNASVKCKVYYFKVIKDGLLVRNFIPALRKSDNKPGLYDRVTQTFYTNGGTDEFLYEE